MRSQNNELAKVQTQQILKPTRYANETDSVMMNMYDVVVALHYEIENRKKYKVLPKDSLVTLEAQIGSGELKSSYSYEISRNYKVGKEINEIETGLYALIDEIIRTIVQSNKLEKVTNTVENLEEDSLATKFDSLEKYKEKQEETSQEENATQLTEFTDKLISSIVYLTGITSITSEGFNQYKNHRITALERIVKTEDKPIKATELLDSITDVLNISPVVRRNKLNAQEAALDYLEAFQKNNTSLVLSIQHAQVMVESFASGYAAIARKRDNAVYIPSDIADHALNSFFDGGFKGFFALSLVGESVANVLLPMAGYTEKVDIPGWYIGAAAEFAWPYIKAPFKLATRGYVYKKELAQLVKSTNTKLLACPQGKVGELEKFIENKRINIQSEREKDKDD